jgi:hypothetical protein
MFIVMFIIIILVKYKNYNLVVVTRAGFAPRTRNLVVVTRAGFAPRTRNLVNYLCLMVFIHLILS